MGAMTGTWDEVREAAFTACLLIYGPRPNIPRGDLEGGLDRLIDWDRQVLDYLVNRYGDYVLLKPPMKPATYALWFGAPALLVLGGIGLVLAQRRRRAAPDVPAPLSPEEKARLQELLKEGAE